ncbi:hypothetical protein [Paucisalibacillus sp. EB02]|uniref:hypothetical protein n=1 Tax=Paucisalibacillus sp. EB02 TaxID=1347087 RepID=UPI0004B37E3D|nr:hypothetical protein [Paucisalibacillus sp. EB02]
MRRGFIIFMFFLLVGCSHTQEQEGAGSPPPVPLEVEETQYSIKMGSYSWTKKGPFTSVTSVTDAPSPNQLAAEMEPVYVKGKSEITIDTTGNPILTVNLWNEEELEKEIPSQGNQFTVPDQAG